MLGLGFFFALFSSASLGLTVVSIRRGVLIGSPTVATLITVLLGVPLFLAVTAATGQLFRGSEIATDGYIALALTSALQMAIGPYSFYRSIQAMGGNQAELFQALHVPISIVIAFVFLGETFDLKTAIGVGLVMAGPAVVVLAQALRRSVSFRQRRRGRVRRSPSPHARRPAVWGDRHRIVQRRRRPRQGWFGRNRAGVAGRTGHLLRRCGRAGELGDRVATVVRASTGKARNPLVLGGSVHRLHRADVTVHGARRRPRLRRRPVDAHRPVVRTRVLIPAEPQA